MLEWLSEKIGAGAAPPKEMTIDMLIRAYRTRPESPFKQVKFNTAKTYSYTMDLIERAAGDVKLASVNLGVLQRFYNDARYPEGVGADKPDRLRTAHGIVAMLRRLFSFGVAAEIEGCERIDRILSKTRFEAPGRRASAMTAEQAAAFIAKARDLGRTSLAIGQAIQFECAMRQRDVIGEWEPIGIDGPTSTFVLNGRQWVNGVTWSDISKDWILTKRTTKTGTVVSWDLRLCPLAFDLLSAIPADDRFGPVVIDETGGRPYAEHAYAREWRAVADAAGIPRDVFNMDARAGAATEADEAGAALDDMRPAMGHSDAKTTARYVRGQSLEQSRRVATLRVAHRSGTSCGTRNWQ